MEKIIDKLNYKPRIIDLKIEENLKIFGAICIEGPKWCGKTWTSSYHSNSEFLVGDPSKNFSNRMFAAIEPYEVLKGDTPRLIGEWQEVPALWDATRAFVDFNTKKGLIILTGSSTPTLKGVLHSGTCRIKSIRMNTMTLFESGDSSGVISLKDLCSNKFSPGILDEISLERLAYLIVRGGWPGNITIPFENCNALAQEYMENVIKTDLNQLDEGIDF